jgi:dipeptidyl aminopeptidase/acylaminoacyl peptidase
VLAPDQPDEEDKRREDERDDADVFGERWQRQRLLRVEPGAAATVVWAPDLHLTDVAWSPDGRRLVVVARATPELDGLTPPALWVLAADGSGTPRQVAQASLTDAVAWSDDGKRLVFLSTQDADPVPAMTCWSVPAEGGEPAAVVGPGRDEPRCAVDMCAPAGSERVVLVVAEGLDTRFEWCHPVSGDRESLAPSAGDVQSLDVVVTGSGPVLAAVVAAGAGPFEAWAGATGRLQRCSTHQALLDDIPLGTVEDFALPGSDGTALDAILIRPPDAPAGPLPMVVLVHGGPYRRSGREAHCQPLDWGSCWRPRGMRC